MSVHLSKKFRWLALGSLLALSSTTAIGCAANTQRPSGDEELDDGSSVDDITQVNHSKVKRQSIGNCWLYATTSWLEALNKEATGEEKNTSESWLTYWHWFEQLANGGVRNEISTGGSYATATDLVLRYGLMLEGDFIPGESDSEMSNRQSRALDTINAVLRNGGPLKDAVEKRDRAAIRAELDRAWGLDEAVIGRLNVVFGRSVTRTLDRSPYASGRAASNKVIRAQDFPTALKDPQAPGKVVGTLADAIGTVGAWWGPRTGKFAWNEVNYPREAGERREFWKRVQRALHDGEPIIASWKVDFNALTSSAVFSLAELQRRGPGRQGGHMTVMHDYQATVPGFGLLKAGEAATPEQMEAALDDNTTIEFIRVKNSWGGIRPDRWSEASIPGYHDLELKYLDGPIKECDEASGPTPAQCNGEVTPLWDVVLPAGY